MHVCEHRESNSSTYQITSFFLLLYIYLYNILLLYTHTHTLHPRQNLVGFKKIKKIL